MRERKREREREKERERPIKPCFKVSRPTSEIGSRMAVCWSTLTAIFCWSSSYQSALWGPNISLINFSSLSPRPGRGREVDNKREWQKERERERGVLMVSGVSSFVGGCQW